MPDIHSDYLNGKKLIGDDFSPTEIAAWYADEKEGYAELGAENKKGIAYGYNHLNQWHGYRHLSHISKFESVLGMGAALGYEFEPIAHKIVDLSIIEPSDQLVSEEVFGLRPKYYKPEVSGTLPFEDNSFDLITCFGTLHHVPNVSHVTKELLRVLRPDGHLLLREPIISMGDWKETRLGLTKRERGIPTSVFEDIFKEKGVKVLRRSLCFCATSFLNRTIAKGLPKPLFAYPAYVRLDSLLSKIFAFNVRYHATRPWQRIAPMSVFYIIKK